MVWSLNVGQRETLCPGDEPHTTLMDISSRGRAREPFQICVSQQNKLSAPVLVFIKATWEGGAPYLIGYQVTPEHSLVPVQVFGALTEAGS